jgi:hypothetical protein
MALHMSEWPARRCAADACNQGRKSCPALDACEQPTDKLLSGYRRCMLSVLVVVVCVLVALWVAA